MLLSLLPFATALAAVFLAIAYRSIYSTETMTSNLLKTLVVPAASGKATASVIFAHGLGDSGLGWLDGECRFRAKRAPSLRKKHAHRSVPFRTLYAVAQMLSRRPSLRHVRFVLPNAPVQPVTLNMGMSMPSWFDITTLEDISGSEDEKGLLKSAGEIKKLVQAEVDGTGDGLNGHKIPAERVVVGGFSQVSPMPALSVLLLKLY